MSRGHEPPIESPRLPSQAFLPAFRRRAAPPSRIARACRFNVPNALTLLRIFLVPLLVVILLTKLPASEYLALAVFLLAALTDWADG